MADEIKTGMPVPLGIVQPSDAPLVDEALAQPKENGAVADQIAALRSEIMRISDCVAAMASQARDAVRSRAGVTETAVEDTIRLHPVLGVLAAAGTGYALAFLLHGSNGER